MNKRTNPSVLNLNFYAPILSIVFENSIRNLVFCGEPVYSELHALQYIYNEFKDWCFAQSYIKKTDIWLSPAQVDSLTCNTLGSFFHHFSESNLVKKNSSFVCTFQTNLKCISLSAVTRTSMDINNRLACFDEESLLSEDEEDGYRSKKTRKSL